MTSILEPYVGRFASAGSASILLDLDTILAGCNAVVNETPAIYSLANNINDCAQDLNANALSVDGKTMIPAIEECVQDISSVQNNINKTVEEIRAAAINAYNNLQKQLNDEAYNREVYETNRYNASRR